MCTQHFGDIKLFCVTLFCSLSEKDLVNLVSILPSVQAYYNILSFFIHNDGKCVIFSNLCNKVKFDDSSFRV